MPLWSQNVSHSSPCSRGPWQGCRFGHRGGNRIALAIKQPPFSAGKRTRLGPTWEPFHAYSSAFPRWKASKKDAKLLICCLTRKPSGFLSSAACYSHSAVNQASVRCFVHCGRFLASLFALTKTFSQPFITWLAIFQVGVTDVIPSSRSR